MKKQLEIRLVELRKEYQIGQQRLAEIERVAANLRATLLRIGGAIQVLEELIASKEESIDTINKT